MKFCAYMVICLSLPFTLHAEDVDTGEPETPPEDEAAVTPAAQAEGFRRYKSILDRMPFGVPPPGFNPDAPSGSGNNSREETAADAAGEAAEAEASEIEQQILSSITVSMLNRSPDGRIFVGFTDKSVQPPRNYLLMVGEKREGCEWMVAGADPDNGEVKISKGGVEATLKMGGGGDSPSGEKAKEGDGAPKGAVAHLPQRARPGMGLDRRHHRRWPQQAHSSGPAVEGEEGEKKQLTGLEIARARRQERINRQLAEEEKQRQAAELAQKEHEEREREKKEREREREQEKRERELAAEERKAQMDQLLQLRDELRRQREEKQAERKDAGEPEEDTPQNNM